MVKEQKDYYLPNKRQTPTTFEDISNYFYGHLFSS